MDLFCFDTTGACRLDSYQKIPLLSEDPVFGLSSRGPRRLVALAGLSTAREDWADVRTYGDLCKVRFSLQQDSPHSPLMAGELLLEDAADRKVLLPLKPMLVKIRLRSIMADFGARPYAGTPFFNTAVFLGFAVTECLPLGPGQVPRPLSWVNAGLPDSLAIMRLPFPDMLLQEGLGTIGPTRLYPGRDFYCYPSEQLRLVLAGRIGEDVCYYPIPLPGLVPGETYELDLTLQRKGTPDPDVPVEVGTVLVETKTVPWEREDPLTVEFPTYED